MAIEPSIVFTNDGPGIIGAIDARIDQVVTAPAIRAEACPKPRGIVLSLANVNNQRRLTAFVACGQPDSSVLVINIPTLARENIADLPTVQTVEPGGKLRLTGTRLSGVQIEVIERGTLACLTLSRGPKTKKGGTVLLQKGSLNDGRQLRQVFTAGGNGILRIIGLDGTVRLVFPPPGDGEE
jgi:hypothetical protein